MYYPAAKFWLYVQCFCFTVLTFTHTYRADKRPTPAATVARVKTTTRTCNKELANHRQLQ